MLFAFVESPLSKHNVMEHSRLFQCQNGRSHFTDATERMSRNLNKPVSRYLYIMGGSICACLIWYFKKPWTELQAKSILTADKDVPEINPRLNRIKGDLLMEQKSFSLQEAICESRRLLQRVKEEYGCPGIAAAVSVNGKLVWREALGLADVENEVPMKPSHVLRVASISKVLTVTALAKLWEEGKVDLDKPVQEYVPSFPLKCWEKETVTITTRQILSHLSGIRHYEKTAANEKHSVSDPKEVSSSKHTDASSTPKVGPNKTGVSNNTSSGVPVKETQKISVNENKSESEPSPKNDRSNEVGDAKYKEFYSQKNYKEVVESLKQFKDDPLVHKPGTKFLYSTHAWTVVSAVVEAAAGKPFLKVMQDMFNDLDLECTLADTHKPIIADRARLYHRDRKKQKLENAAYVDLSNKWAGGGFLSTVSDLIKFADAMLYSYQCSSTSGQLPGYLKQDTVHQMWTPVELAYHKAENGCYGMGWKIIQRPKEHGYCRPSKFIISHSGGAVGASSVVLIASDTVESLPDKDIIPPQGVSVAIVVNLDGVSLHKTAERIAVLFKEVS